MQRMPFFCDAVESLFDHHGHLIDGNLLPPWMPKPCKSAGALQCPLLSVATWGSEHSTATQNCASVRSVRKEALCKRTVS